MLASFAVGLAIWIGPAHRAVAVTAYDLLTPAARIAIDSLLPRDSFVNAGTWADDVRKVRRRTARWHYVNIPITDSVYRPDRHCPNGECIIEVIDRFKVIVADREVSRVSRTEALRFLIHLVADLHQPLHAGDNYDRGGNDRIVVLPDGSKRDLHALWDAALTISPAAWRDSTLLDRIRAKVATNGVLWSSGSTIDWALESHLVAQKLAYAIPPDDKIDEQYLATNGDQAIEQLAKAAVRLATILNEAMARQ